MKQVGTGRGCAHEGGVKNAKTAPGAQITRQSPSKRMVRTISLRHWPTIRQGLEWCGQRSPAAKRALAEQDEGWAAPSSCNKHTQANLGTTMGQRGAQGRIFYPCPSDSFKVRGIPVRG